MPKLRRTGRVRRAPPPPGGFIHLSLLASLRRRPTLQAHGQLLVLGLPLPAPAASRLLRPHLRSGHPLASLRLFLRILRGDQQPSHAASHSPHSVLNSHSLSAALAACARHGSPSPGLSAHAFLVKSGLASDVFAANSLLHFYASFRLHSLARRLFDEMPARDVVSFNTMLSSYAQSCCTEDAFRVFRIMMEKELRPDGWTVTALMSMCAGLGNLRVAKTVHAFARRALQPQVFDSGDVAIRMVDMYIKCRGLALAMQVFDLVGEKTRDIRLWSTMVSGCAGVGEVDMARSLFDDMPKKDLIAWTALIAGFVRAGKHKEALDFFQEMEDAGFEADEVTVVTVISACVRCGMIDLAKRLHHRVERDGLISKNARLATAFVDMYAKHGCIQTALDVFCGVGDKFKTVELFNVMINGLSHHSFGDKAIKIFEEMGSLGLHPDKITFVSVLCACSRSGLVSQGFQIFDSMLDKYGVKQDIWHYTCMADLLARNGRLDDAYQFIHNMPFKANHMVWASLLRACRIHGNSKIGNLAEEKILQCDPTYKPEKMVLSDVFSSKNRKERAARIRKAINYKPKHKHAKNS